MILAHRGRHADVPENTIAAFAAAESEGLAGVETDVRVTADGELVLFHDRASPDGRTVAAATREELSRAAGYEVPLLADALAAFPRLFFDVEVKVPRAGRPALAAIDRAGAADRVVVTSFRHDLIADLAGETEIPLGLILASRPADLHDAFLPAWRHRSGVRTLALDVEVADEALVRTIRAEGFAVFLWGFRTPVEVAAAEGWDPTALVT